MAEGDCLYVFLTALCLILSICDIQACDTWVRFEKRGLFLEPIQHQPYLRSLNGNIKDCQAACVLDTRCRTVFFAAVDGTCILSKWDKVSPSENYQESLSATYVLYRKPGGYSSCSKVKEKFPGALDGEYWLYPIAEHYLSNPAKLYCEGMGSGTPKEYVTLQNANIGNFPQLANYGCLGESTNLPPGHKNSAGQTTYTKIGVQINTMEVVRSDMTYATSTGQLHNYGEARDCYADIRNGNNCGPKGTFVVNTLGTGLVFPATLQWALSDGWAEAIGHVTRSNNDAVIDLLCGGWCGGCVPDGPMVLHFSTNEEIDPKSATMLF